MPKTNRNSELENMYKKETDKNRHYSYSTALRLW